MTTLHIASKDDRAKTIANFLSNGNSKMQGSSFHMCPSYVFEHHGRQHIFSSLLNVGLFRYEMPPEYKSWQSENCPVLDTAVPLAKKPVPCEFNSRLMENLQSLGRKA